MDRVSSDVLSRTVDGEEVLLDLATQAYFGLNATATIIWRLIKEGRSPGRIAKALTEEFDLPPRQARRDVFELIRELKKRGLLTRAK